MTRVTNRLIHVKQTVERETKDDAVASKNAEMLNIFVDETLERMFDEIDETLDVMLEDALEEKLEMAETMVVSENNNRSRHKIGTVAQVDLSQ